MEQPISENVEYLAECLSVALEVTPLLEDDERAQLAAMHPFATPYWLDGLLASGRSQPTQDTQLIAQLTQKLQQFSEPSEDGDDGRSHSGGGSGGADDSREGSTIPWSEFAGDDDEGVVEPADAAEAEEMGRRRQERSETRFNSISEEIKAINEGLIDASEMSTVQSVDNRQPCPQCNRKFLPDRLHRHVKVCEDLKRGKEWRGTWKSPSAGGGSKNQLLIAGRE